MHIGCVLGGPLPSALFDRATTFKYHVEDVALADQAKKCYEVEKYGWFYKAYPRSIAEKRGPKLLKSTTIGEGGSRYSIDKLWTDDQIAHPY